MSILKDFNFNNLAVSETLRLPIEDQSQKKLAKKGFLNLDSSVNQLYVSDGRGGWTEAVRNISDLSVSNISSSDEDNVAIKVGSETTLTSISPSISVSPYLSTTPASHPSIPVECFFGGNVTYNTELATNVTFPTKQAIIDSSKDVSESTGFGPTGTIYYPLKYEVYVYNLGPNALTFTAPSGFQYAPSTFDDLPINTLRPFSFLRGSNDQDWFIYQKHADFTNV